MTTVQQSKYGTFKYGERKYGKNVSIGETVDIVTCQVVEHEDGFYLLIEDKTSISESLTIQTSRSFSDSLSISEALAKSYGKKPTDSISFVESLARIVEFYLSLSDSLSIDDGTVKSESLVLSDSVSFSESVVRDLSEGKDPKSEWKFLVKDSSGDVIASLVNARSRWFVERLNQETEAGFILDADDDKCDELNLGVNELHIYYEDTLKWAGQLVSARKIAKGNDVYWEVLAKDWVALLGKRFCGVESIREFTTTDAGTIAWTLIDEAQSLANGDFGITEGTIQASVTRSPIYDKKNILEAIRELSNMGVDGDSNYGFDFEVTPLKVFNVYYPYKGTVHNDIVFRYPGNCENFEAFVNSWDIVNQEWGIGRHWTGNTALISRSDATSQTTYKRREAIRSYKDMSVLASLQDMVWQDIQWLKDPSTVIRFEARVDEKTGINSYNVGDGVTVVCNKFGIDEWLWVYERRIEIGDNDELKITLTVGD